MAFCSVQDPGELTYTERSRCFKLVVSVISGNVIVIGKNKPNLANAQTNFQEQSPLGSP
jgi:hypothetical protein